MNVETIASELSRKEFGLDDWVEQTLNNRVIRETIVNLTLNDPNIMVYYHGYYILSRATEIKPRPFYEFWKGFEELLGHKNSYHRDIGLNILANLSGVDEQDCFDDVFEDYFRHLYDEKFMTACCCIENVKVVLSHRSDYTSRVVPILLEHRKHSPYPEKQEALMESDILEVFEQVYASYPEKEQIKAFIVRACDSISPKTRKYAKRLLKQEKYR